MASASLRRLCLTRSPIMRQMRCLRLSPLSVAPVKLKLFCANGGMSNTCKQYPFAQIRCTSTDKPDGGEAPKPGLVQRFKQMYRDYWYVLVPVHVITSLGWFGAFYYAAKSGIDIVGLMESVGFSESITSHLKDSSMGYVAVAYALYKIATPLRYTVTLGGTTISINYLKEWGYIKPVPSTEKLKEMYTERKDSLLVKMREKTDEFKLSKEHLKKNEDNGAAKEIKDSAAATTTTTKDK